MSACIVCGTSPARYGQVCGAACDVVTGSREDYTPLAVAIVVLAFVAGLILIGVLR